MDILATAVALLLAASALGSGPSAEPTTSPANDADQVVVLGWEVVSRRPHDGDAFTQGLLLDGTGRLFESTGLQGRSTVREVDPVTGEVLRLRRQPEAYFSEGLALVGDELVQLSWQNGIARRYAVDTFEPVGSHRYEGEGWGLCYDGERLVMSDGSDRLTFRDATTFEELGSVAVTAAGEPVVRLNELECVDGAVWANVWLSDTIVRIDPRDGRVTGRLDLAGIRGSNPAEAALPGSAVLNGIAYDAAADTFLVTGKLWPELIEIRLLEADRQA